MGKNYLNVQYGTPPTITTPVLFISTMFDGIGGFSATIQSYMGTYTYQHVAGGKEKPFQRV